MSHCWSGLEGIKRLKALDESLNDPGGVSTLADQMEAIHDALRRAPRKLLLVGEDGDEQTMLSAMQAEWQAMDEPDNASEFRCPQPGGSSRVGWSTNTQVSFNAKAFATVPQAHSDAAALSVLGPFLRNGYLHRTIREQGGAYGAGASYDSDSASFCFFSYRDPRLDETLDDFDASVSWMLETEHDPRSLEEAILGVVSSIDRPGSPAGEAVKAYFGTLHGRTPEQRRRFREQILSVSLNDLRRVAETYLRAQEGSVAVLSSANALADCRGDLTVFPL